MAENHNLPVNTFTVGFAGQGVEHLNEFEHARRIAKQIGANHQEVVIDHRSVLDYLPRFLEHQDEPVADPVCVPTKRNAGPALAMTMRAVPSPFSEVKPAVSSVMTTVCVRR